MHERLINDITPESVLEKMKEDGVIDEEVYREMKFRFEDIEDIHKLNYYQVYDKAYRNNRVHKCIEVLLEIAKKEPNTLKKGMLLSNCLKNPMGMKYSEQEYKKTMCILTETIKAAKEQNYNMIDNVLNNGAEKKETEQSKGRISIRDKLAEKKAVIEKRDKAERNCPEKDTEKKVHREM